MRWQADVASAHAELKRRTGTERVTAIGVRLGATLLCTALARLDVERVILWDPILDGATYVARASVHDAKGVARARRFLADLRDVGDRTVHDELIGAVRNLPVDGLRRIERWNERVEAIIQRPPGLLDLLAHASSLSMALSS